MSSTILEKVQSSLGRMDYLLTLSIATFVQKTVTRFLTSIDILYISLVTSVCTNDRKLNNEEGLRQNRGTLTIIMFTLHKISSILLIDSVMRYSTQTSPKNTNQHTIVMSYLVSTTLVIFVALIPERYQQTTTGSQVVRLAFFLYAENTSLFTNDAELKRVIPFLALVILLFLHNITETEKTAKTPLTAVTGTVVRAFSMLMTNLFITTTLDITDNESTVIVDAVWMVGALVIFDNLRGEAPVFTDLKDYAVWKAARQIQQTAHLQITANNNDNANVFILLCSVLAIVVLIILQRFAESKQHQLRWDAAIDLNILICVNCVIGAIKEIIQNTPKSFILHILVSALTVTQVGLLHLQS